MSPGLDRFLARVQDRSGQPDAAVVELAVRATLRTLGSHLGGVPPALHDALPRALRPELAAGEGGEPVRPAELYQQVAEQGRVRAGVALELVLSTIAELTASLVESSALELLRTSLPPAWAALLTDPLKTRDSSRPPSAGRRTETSGMFKVTEGSGAHKLTEGSGAHRLTEGSGAYKLTEGSGAHKVPDGSGAARKRREGSGAHKGNEGSGAHKLTEGSGAHKITEGSGAHKITEGSGAHRITEGSGAHKITEGSGAHKITEGSGAHTLASGRPGSSRPPSEAHPSADQADANVASDDSDSDRLATARGPGAQDEERTLADGRRRTPLDDD
jgi:uncharacterized protein (DUF2267 family)